MSQINPNVPVRTARLKLCKENNISVRPAVNSTSEAVQKLAEKLCTKLKKVTSLNNCCVLKNSTQTVEDLPGLQTTPNFYQQSYLRQRIYAIINHILKDTCIKNSITKELRMVIRIICNLSNIISPKEGSATGLQISGLINTIL